MIDLLGGERNPFTPMDPRWMQWERDIHEGRSPAEAAMARQKAQRTFQEWLEGPEEDLFGDQPEAATGDPGALGRE